MPDKTLTKLEADIRQVQVALASLGPMRPGTLSQQFRQPKTREGECSQLSYTYQGKSRTEYVRPAEVAAVRQEVAEYQRFKTLTARWVDLALERSRRQRDLARARRVAP